MARAKRSTQARKSVSRFTSPEQVGGGEGESLPPEVQMVRKLFTEAQRTDQSHGPCCQSLCTILARHESAWAEYLMCVSRILVVNKGDPGVERLVHFVAMVAGSRTRAAGLTGQSEDESILSRTVRFLVERSGAADKAVRYRCCQLLGVWAIMWKQDEELPSTLADYVVLKMLPRLQDKVATVRVQAIGALRFLQMQLTEEEIAEGGNDEVTERIMRMMMSDSSPDVRQAALDAVFKTPDMLDQLVLRTQDVQERVRKAAFATLAKHVPVKLLRPRQMVVLMQTGLSDGSKAVVDVCLFMLCTSWMRDDGGDPVKLLERFDVVSHEDLTAKVVKEIVSLGLRADRERGDHNLGLNLTLADAKALRQAAARRVDVVSIPSTVTIVTSPAVGGAASTDSEALSAGGGGDNGDGEEAGLKAVSPEEALFARVQAETIQEDKDMSADEKETRLEAISPDTTSLCAQIERLSEELCVKIAEQEEGFEVDIDGDVFVLKQLLKLAARADFSEEAGRIRLVQLLQAQLVNTKTHPDLVEVSMLALAAAHQSEADLVRLVAELVSDISDHLKVGGAAIVPNSPTVTDASFTSLTAGGVGERKELDGGDRRSSLDQSVISQRTNRTTIRASIPKNFVRDRTRVFEGGRGSATSAGIDSDDELFVDALSHVTSDKNGKAKDNDIRSVAAGGGADEGDSSGAFEENGEEVQQGSKEEELMLDRMFRVLDMLSALLAKTNQSLTRDSTLAGFDLIIMESFEWYHATSDVDAQVELRQLCVQCLGRYSLLGEMAAVRHRPRLFQIAECEEELPLVRLCAMQALSDLSLVYGGVIVESSGDLIGLYASVLKARHQFHQYHPVYGHKRMVAVAAEATARLLYFKLAHDPEVLARLFVLYFEKGSVADVSAANAGGGGGGGGDDEDGHGDEGEASGKDPGSPVRLSQILELYFRCIPFGGPKVRDMVLASARHVLVVLREAALLNAASETDAEGKKEFETLEADEKHIIEVPVQNTVKFVLDLLIREGTASAVAGSPISVVGKKNSRDSTVVSEELDEENFSKDPAAGGDSDQSRALGTKSTSRGSDKTDVSQTERAVEDATGHVALCVAEEMFKCSGINELAGTHMPCLAKVLASLPLPENDQAAVKRLRRSVENLLALGNGRLNAKVLRVMKKYAQTLWDADLTPYEGMEDEDEEGRVDLHDDDEDQGEADEGEAYPLEGQKKKNGPRASSSCRPTVIPPVRPSRQSKVTAKARMSSVAWQEEAAAAADAADMASKSSGSDGEAGEESKGDVEREGGDEKEEVVDEDQFIEVEDDRGDESDADSDTDSENSTATVKTRSPVRAKRQHRPDSRLSGRREAAPLGEIGNSPAPEGRNRRGL